MGKKNLGPQKFGSNWVLQLVYYGVLLRQHYVLYTDICQNILGNAGLYQTLKDLTGLFQTIFEETVLYLTMMEYSALCKLYHSNLEYTGL